MFWLVRISPILTTALGLIVAYYVEQAAPLLLCLLFANGFTVVAIRWPNLVLRLVACGLNLVALACTAFWLFATAGIEEVPAHVKIISLLIFVGVACNFAGVSRPKPYVRAEKQREAKDHRLS